MFDQGIMRSHLTACLELGMVSDFPVVCQHTVQRQYAKTRCREAILYVLDIVRVWRMYVVM